MAKDDDITVADCQYCARLGRSTRLQKQLRLFLDAVLAKFLKVDIQAPLSIKKSSNQNELVLTDWYLKVTMVLPVTTLPLRSTMTVFVDS